MYIYPQKYDVIIIGAGHAGCEAALSVSRMGCKALLLTMNLDTVAYMSCNPAIGGLAKGHIVREIDALGGEMAKAIDATGIQFRMLNTRKGPAVWAPRAQADKKLYNIYMKKVVEQQNNLDIKQLIVDKIKVKDNRVQGVITHTGVFIKSKAIIIATGTFLNGLIHMGEVSYSAGRQGEFASTELSASIRKLGFKIGRLKTGTPARVNMNSIDFSKLKIQPADKEPKPFSFTNEKVKQEQIPCHITYTNLKTHAIIKENLHRSPLYSGKITGIGPRYCPSIEDKIIRFSEKNRHQVFLEPEGLNTNEVYLNGLSTSLPQDVQVNMLQSIEGLENVEIMRFGYAIEYDFVKPTQLMPTLETKILQGLYLAGQINGTSGYEEAACQGLMAGINAVLKIKNKQPFILSRTDAYIGVLIDDLVTKGTEEPYRMFTSRAEHRLLLRQDNADIRLMRYGYELGLIPQNQYKELCSKTEKIQKEIIRLKKTFYHNSSLAKLLRKPDMTYDKLPLKNKNITYEEMKKIKLAIETEIKYEGYIKKEQTAINKFKRLEKTKIPKTFDYQAINGLRNEAVEKLKDIKPLTIGHASRISGISPSDIATLMVHLKRGLN